MRRGICLYHHKKERQINNWVILFGANDRTCESSFPADVFSNSFNCHVVISYNTYKLIHNFGRKIKFSNNNRFKKKKMGKYVER